MTDPIVKNPPSPIAQRMIDRARREYKKLSWKARALPDFLIIGCQKGGTSSLHNYLVQHPRLFSGDVKEVHFFDGGLDPQWDKYSEGERLYRSYFPRASAVRAAGGLLFEATPEYMHNRNAPERMARLLPTAKLIALLRDPVERTISNYFHEVRRGREKRPIMQALLAEEEILAPVRGNDRYKDTRWIWKAYATRSLYAEQLEKVFAYYRRDQVLILESSEFYNDPELTLRQVLDFVGMDSQGLDIDFTPVGVGSNRTKVEPQVYDWLQERFREPNKKLEALLGRKFDWIV